MATRIAAWTVGLIGAALALEKVQVTFGKLRADSAGELPPAVFGFVVNANVDHRCLREKKKNGKPLPVNFGCSPPFKLVSLSIPASVTR
jgi:hypothetical protein